MPAILNERRAKLFLTKFSAVQEMKSLDKLCKGDLTYLLCTIALSWLEIMGYSYQNISDVKASLTDARDEIHDRIMRPYEDGKYETNGDLAGFKNFLGRDKQ